VKDKLGGTIWNGKHLLPGWYKKQCSLYFDRPDMLQEPLLVLRQSKITKKKLRMSIDDCKKYLATIPCRPRLSKKRRCPEKQPLTVSQKVGRDRVNLTTAKATRC
jgi:hypothetical protein